MEVGSVKGRQLNPKEQVRALSPGQPPSVSLGHFCDFPSVLVRTFFSADSNEKIASMFFQKIFKQVFEQGCTGLDWE